MSFGERTTGRRAARAAVVALALTGTAGLVQSEEVVVAANSTAESAELVTLDVVTVTARRRNEDAQRVPIPIAALEGKVLEEAGQVRLEQLNQRLPSTNVQFSNPRQTSIAVRGLGNNPANDALESSVGLYLDNVYLGRPSMANLDLVDISQLELLRGPQGTLFGKNTTAGVLNVATRQPNDRFGGTIENSSGGFGFLQARATITGPIAGEALTGRLSVAKTHQDGYIKDTTDGRKLNGFNRDGLRGQLLWKPSENFSLRAIADYNTEHSNCCVSVLYSTGPNNGAAYASLLSFSGAQSVYDPDYRTATIDGQQHMSVHQGGASLEANWKLGSYTLTSITAYRDWWFQPLNDGDSTNLRAVITAGQHVDDRQYSQELRLASPDERSLQYVVGAFYFYQDQNNRAYQQFGPDAGVWLGTYNPATNTWAARAFLNNGYTDTLQYLKTSSASAFAQATWHASDALSVTAGLRDTVENKLTQVDRQAPVGTPLFQAVNNAYSTGRLRLHDNSVSALLSADYKLSDTALLYASLARGAKAGGINPSVPTGVRAALAGVFPTASDGLGTASLYIKPERAVDGELGVKTSWLDHRITANANLFWADVSDYQATLLQLDGNGTFQQVLSNIGKVRTRGVETELAAAFASGLNLNLTASYNDAKYASYVNAPCSAELLVGTPVNCVQDLTGKAVVGAPKVIVNPGIDFSHAYTNSVSGTLAANYAWRSAYYGSADNSELAKVQAFGVLNLRYSLSGKLNSNTWTVSLWANNALDKRYVIGGLGVASASRSYALYPGAPRIVGATLRYEF